MTKQLLLASLLGDNPGREFTYDELRTLLKSYSRRSIYDLINRLRAAGMDIEVKRGIITYKGSL